FARAETRRFDGAVRFGWQHPLTTEAGREGATLVSEFEAALAAKAYEDAVRLLPSITALDGLVPPLGDPNRLTRPARLVSEAAEQHSALVELLAERFGPSGLIRVRSAAAAGDVEAMKLAAIQFYGTPAAAEA